MSENQEVIEKKEEIQSKIESTPEVNAEQSPVIKTEENQANWRKFREEKDRERKARQEAEALSEKRRLEAEALKAALESVINKPYQNTQQQHYEFEESEESIIEKKVQAALEKERQRYQQEQAKKEASELPQKVYKAMPDMDNVCSQENLDYLDFHHPEISKAFKYIPEGFDKYETIYKTIKKYVPYQNKNQDQARIEKNMQKPQATIPNMTDKNPVGSPWKLSEERKRENWKRMQQDRKSFG